ncbi:unnamed protein product [Parajaminaea phylloscopi]
MSSNPVGSTLPVPIRRAGPNDNVDRSTLSSTPGGANFLGCTPGGTKIMYSREQLLALSTSPLARSPAQGLASIPAAISKSPEKSANFGAHMAALRASADSQQQQQQQQTSTLGSGAANQPGAAQAVFGAASKEPSTQQGGATGKPQDEQFEMDL